MENYDRDKEKHKNATFYLLLGHAVAEIGRILFEVLAIVRYFSMH